MLKQIFSRILAPRHKWRTIGFDELSELYVSQFLRSLGVNLVGLFIPIYLYKIGYNLGQIAYFFVCWFVFRVFFDYISARFIAKYGPKHGMFVGCILHSVYLALILTIKTQHWPFILVASVGSFAYGLHILALQVDFSKIKHVDHGGKELGFLSIVDKLGGVVGPLVGGLLANYFDPRYAVGLAGLMLLVSAVPLFLSKEPVLKNQTLDFLGIPYAERYRDYLSAIPNTVENTITLVVC
jgi:MFS family permease